MFKSLPIWIKENLKKKTKSTYTAMRFIPTIEDNMFA